MYNAANRDGSCLADHGGRMTSFSIKSILLGIGIGIIITSIAGMIYFAGLDPIKDLSENDIIELENRYGLTRVSPLTTESPQETSQED